MFDIGWPEIVVILIVALLVIGPRDLPKAFHTVGKWVRAARRVTADFQRHVDDMMRETELEDLRKVANEARSFNVKKQLEDTIDPGGDLKGAFDVTGKPEAKPKATAATPGVPTDPPAENAIEAPPAPATETAPKKAAKPAAKPAKAAAKPDKPAAKSKPRVPSRVPKRKAATAGAPTAAKASPSEQTS